MKDRTGFLVELWEELLVLNKKGKYAIRLNLLSDVNWEEQFQTIGKSLGDLTNIQFYDYTKDPFKIEGNNLTNYNFTFSYSGGNWKWCEKFLKEKRANVAVVFKNTIPLQYKNYVTINADESDERFLDKKGVICGLKYKNPKNGTKYSINKFVVDN